MGLLWILCLPIAAVIAAAIAERAFDATTKRAAPIVPGRVLAFDLARRRPPHAPYRAPAPAVVGSGRVIMLHEARRRRSNPAGENALQASR
jgi:hypothetical protein